MDPSGAARSSHRAPLIWLISAGIALSCSVLAATRQTGAVPLRTMLREAYELVQKRYYDKTYHGLDWDARYKDFEAKIRATTSVNAGLGLVAQFLDGLKDSHTYFIPPSRPFDHDYGYRLQLIGDKTFIARVVPKTDAEAKLQPGDEVLAVNGFVPSRETLSTVNYILNVLAPIETVDMWVRNPAGVRRQVLVNARIVEKPHQRAEWDPLAIYRTKDDPTRVEPQRFTSIGDVLIWAMPDFLVEDRIVDGMWERARRHRAVILDLRGNPGGVTTTLNRMLANAFDRDIKAYEFVERKGRTPELVKSRKDNAFTGALTVLVDSNSGSAAELFARIIQLEKRGVVIGDRSAGGVMAARMYEGESRHLFYAFVITDADLVMNDGKSLEIVGVVPDETMLPTAADLAAGRDPVLAHAAAKLGITLDAAAAAKIFEKKVGGGS